MEEQTMRNIDVDGDGNLTQEELLAAAKTLLSKEKEADRWRSMGFSLLGVIVLLVGVRAPLHPTPPPHTASLLSLT